MPEVSVITVTHNSQVTIHSCLESVLNQAGVISIEILLVDNASIDQTTTIPSHSPKVKIIQNSHNLGFCSANNLGFERALGKYILFLNPDAVLTPDFLSTTLALMGNKPDAALLTGKVLLLNQNSQPSQRDRRALIDTAGIVMHRNRQAIDIGQGEIDQGKFDQEREVFGVSAAVCLCRRKALEDVMIDGQVFDNAFFAYKEDVDLSWRLRLKGWKCFYTPRAIAYHARGWRPGLQYRKEIPRFARYHSFKNRRLMILKNDTFRTILPDLPHILWYELRALIYAMIREPFLLKTYWAIIKDIPRIQRWRKQIHGE